MHINFSGYLVISLFLFAVWTFNFFLFDRQTYLIFTPGQVRARVEIGGGETVYDTTGMTVQKQRGDLFRHLILGFGSGDLVVRPARGDRNRRPQRPSRRLGREADRNDDQGKDGRRAEVNNAPRRRLRLSVRVVASVR